MPIGTSTRPVLLILPTSENTAVPLLRSVPIDEYQPDPLLMITGTLAQVFTLLMTVGLPQRPFCTGYGGRGCGSPTLPSMDAISAVSSPQTKAPAPSATLAGFPVFVDHLLRTEFAQNPRQRAVPADADVVPNLLGIDAAVIAEQVPLLAGVELDVVLVNDALAVGAFVEQFLDRLVPVHQAGNDNLRVARAN